VAAEQVVEQVAETLEDAADVTRHIDTRLVRYFLGGVGVGAAIGFFVGYRYNREKIKAEAFQESEEEIERIRKHYQDKMTAKENETAKEELTTLVVEEGYARIEDEPQPISDLRDLSSPEEHPLADRPLPAPVPVTPARRVFRSTDTEKDKNDGWNFARELQLRSSDRPHIIHQDEFTHNETEFAQVTYTYYAEDDVLVDESEEVITDREALIGVGTLNRFGHGTDDFNILYVRHPVLELEIEICRSSGSYEVEVLGLEREPGNGVTT
jgi:hypothetical protein